MSIKQLYDHQIGEYKKIISEMEKEKTKKSKGLQGNNGDLAGYNEGIRAKNEEIAQLEDQNHDLHLQLLSLQNCQNQDERKTQEQSVFTHNQNLKLQILKLNQQLKEMKEIDEETDMNGDQNDLNSLKIKLKQQTIRANELEDQLVEAKMSWATLDMENDELTFKM